ncbi:lysozyme inhibitor LprI family protein [Pseudodesulfovibrio sp.]|uniref:lysozyme inhibitor LprI family protein n=1 Tax=unclassified Pseudodesulfovibrio TaxID=2661612 RepID=UPI003B00F80D
MQKTTIGTGSSGTMQYILGIICVLTLVGGLPAFAQETGAPAPAESSSDPLSDCSVAEIDRQMYAVIAKIKAEYADDTHFLEKLDASQTAWEAYREAYLLSIYPEKDVQYMYGSVFSSCWCFRYTEKTKERISELRIWLDKVEEGDVCSGSIRFIGQ